jgi:uncharacterized protein (TIGR04255 family)
MAFEPINKEHGIAQVSVVITLHEPLEKKFGAIAQKIIDKKGVLVHYKPLLRQQVQFKHNEIERGRPEEMGFMLTDSQQQPTVTWRGLNEENRTVLIYSTNTYYRWNLFFEQFKSILLSTQTALKKNRVLAIGLEYIDQFNWTVDTGNFSWTELFKKGTTMLPEDFYEHTHLQFKVLRNRSIRQIENVSEQLEILRSDSKTAIIRHHVSAIPQQDVNTEQFNDPSFLSQIKNLHSFNKEVLKELLTKKMVERVGLNKHPST